VWDAETGQCLEVLDGFSDVTAITGGRSKPGYRAFGRNAETVVERESGEAVAWFSKKFYILAAHPSVSWFSVKWKVGLAELAGYRG
jgi:formylmethanofuran dehydrogenase subunit E